MEKFMEGFIENKKSLTDSQRKIASQISDNPQRFFMLRIEDFSKRMGVSKATVSRFVKHLGFSKYQDFQLFLKERVLERTSSAKRVSGEAPCLLRDEADNMAENYSAALKKKLEKVSKLIHNKKRIYLVGRGPAAPLSEFLEYRLSKLGVDVRALKVGGVEFLEDILSLEKEDLLVLLTFTKVTPEIMVAQEYARRRECESVLFIEESFSELSDRSDHLIPFKRASINASKSLAYPMFLLNILVSKVEELNLRRVHTMKKEMTWLKKEYVSLLKNII